MVMEKFKSPFMFIILITFFSHGLLLLNDGIYWDAWYLHHFISQNDFGHLYEWMNEAGFPESAYLHWGVGLFGQIIGNLVFAQRIVTFVTILINFFACYEIAKLFTSPIQSVYFALFCIIFPAFKVYMQSDMLRYSLAISYFLLAATIFLKQIKQTKEPIILNIIGFALFVSSFTISSLLVFYFGFISLYVYTLLKRQIDQKLLHLLTIKNILLLFLPFMYWGVKSVFFPRHGAYADYNQFILTINSLALHIQKFLDYSIVFPFSHELPVYSVIIVLLVSGWNWKVISPYLNDHNLKISCKYLAKAGAYGFILLILSILPYVLVGKSPTPYGMETRNALLIAFPMSIFIVVFVNAFFSPRLQSLIFCILIFSFAIQNIENYINYQARWVKDISLIQNLRASAIFKNSSLIYVADDNFYIEGTDIWYTSDWNGIAKMVFLEEKRAFFAHPFTNNELEFSQNIKTAQFQPRYLQTDIDLLGCRAKMTIFKGDRQHNNTMLVLRYFYYRFFNPDHLEAFLAPVTYLRIDPIPTFEAVNCKSW